MLPFQKLPAYQKSKDLIRGIEDLTLSDRFDSFTREVFRKVSIDIMLHIAASYGSNDNRGEAGRLISAKESAYQLIALLDFQKDSGVLDEYSYLDYVSAITDIVSSLNSQLRKLDS